MTTRPSKSVPRCSHPDCRKLSVIDTDLGFLCNDHFNEALRICADEDRRMALEEMKPLTEVVQ